MDGFIKEIKKDIKKTFNADDFEKEKALIKQEYETKRVALLEKLNTDAAKYNFAVKICSKWYLYDPYPRW